MLDVFCTTTQEEEKQSNNRERDKKMVKLKESINDNDMIQVCFF